MLNQQNTTKAIVRFSERNALVTRKVSNQSAQPVKAKVKVNHIIAIDVSGSMSYELKAIREQLKAKLPTLVGPEDTVTILAFSGRNECVTLVVDHKVVDIRDIEKLNTAIDRYLRPIGLTSFKEPLTTVGELVRKINRAGEAYSMLFLTDGYDNQSTESTLIGIAKTLEPVLNNAVFIEYGYYCNSKLLNRLAEEVGGQVIFSDGFDAYDPVFVSYIQKDNMSAKKISVQLEETPKFGLVYALDGTDILVFKTDANNEVLVSEHIESVSYLIDPAATKGESYYALDFERLAEKKTEPYARSVVQNLYALIYVLAQRMKTDEVYDVLGSIGDAELIQEFTNAFGKQNLARFQNNVYAIVKEEREPFAQGYKAGMVPREDAYCILNLFEDLSADGNLWYPSHPSFTYKAIGSKKAQTSGKVSEADLARVAELSDRMKAESDPMKMMVISLEIAALVAEIDAKVFELKFELLEDQGQPISSLVWNESRPNVSFQTRQDGIVRLPANDFGLTEIETFRYRNYTFVKDGLVNVDKLPVRLSYGTAAKIKAVAPEVISGFDGDIIILDLTKLPVINRSMVRNVSAKALFTKSYELMQLKATQSVFNYLQKTFFPRVSEGYAQLFGPDAADWLKSIGITDFNGFAPKVTEEKIGEMYVSKELNVKIKGLSSLPTVKDVLAKLEAGKALTPREEVMREGIKAYQIYRSGVDKTLSDEETAAQFKVWLENMQRGVRQEVRKRQADIAQIKFGVIVGQAWFEEFETLDETKLILDINGRSLEFDVEMSDKEVEI